ncbi:nucleotidyltransferase domain-containing protein [Halalkalibacter urbisdiaboli]|uniref:nucleotidyltransferase domain-containing protein n=1 Tax=Halalkalibacter urbisdiaboli TaxID=1960589 RepID=UPI000B448A0D|nr:nucleotidyltransferase domain-containing protein [Halalkalibacter urbisdiaboli]
MSEIKRQPPIEAARSLISKRFPTCQGALLAGSVIRGEQTATSDLDIVVFEEDLHFAYRESFFENEWPVELFVYNLQSYKSFFESDCKRARPCLPRMVLEGVVLKDEGIISSIKKEAAHLLNKGPEPWSDETINMKRYFITDALDDLIGCSNRGEELFIANKLTELLSEFYLRTNQQWGGDSKWVVRALKEYDDSFATRFIEVFDEFYKTGGKDKVISFTEKVVDPYGGRLFEGFSIGKREWK